MYDARVELNQEDIQQNGHIRCTVRREYGNIRANYEISVHDAM